MISYILQRVLWLLLFFVVEVLPDDLGPDAAIQAAMIMSLGTTTLIASIVAFIVYSWVGYIVLAVYLLEGMLFNLLWKYEWGYGFFFKKSDLQQVQ